MIRLGQEMPCQYPGCTNCFTKTNYACKYCKSCAKKIKKERRKEDRKEKKEMKRDQKICLDCRNPATSGDFCGEHLERHNRYKKNSAAKVRKDRVEKGLCVQCGEPAPSGVFCLKHLEQHRQRSSEAYHNRAEAGLCPNCGVSSASGGYCGDCAGKRKINSMRSASVGNLKKALKLLHPSHLCPQKIYVSNLDTIFAELQELVAHNEKKARRIVGSNGHPDSKKYNTEYKFGADVLRWEQIVRSSLHAITGVPYKVTWAEDVGDLEYGQVKRFETAKDFIRAQLGGDIFS